MKKAIWFLLGVMVFLTACSNEQENIGESSEDFAMDSVEESMDEAGKQGTESSETENNESTEVETKEVEVEERKIIYTANLRLEVKEYQQAVDEIESQVADFNGYIVDSSTYGSSEESSTSGHITARIPQERFQEFIQLVEEGAGKLLESNVSGQDVTEEYVDLESRLKSKRVVEERLLSFMEKAEKTEDLLTISSDLAKVQEEIEQVTGRMNYLRNKADLATVQIDIEENNVNITGMSEDELNTWERTKQQFLKSINTILAVLSGLFVFIAGNLPILIPLGVIALVVWLVVKRKRSTIKKEDKDNLV
ncbi:hypothetical protein BN988_01344 [Oceanobacillus picturae]|uniref:DUF4349 domain-containing protein n=1 Tax=Oceanobacillus picturae TaxID=171693 RepID=W9AAU4_9BACI|nr:DUF4349 domain-containing protein [Oceanobacillus picturae]CDO02864.1 hypothetical protein BN988_01344 [Oceanobacillus picturae]